MRPAERPAVMRPRYLYQRSNSPHWWFELKIPKDVQAKLGRSRVRKSTHTDSLRKASRLANIWAEELWGQIEAARGPDWDYHNIKSGLRDLRDQGLSPEEMDDIALQVLTDDRQPERSGTRYEAYERAANKVVVLKDHLEDYLSWCSDNGNSPKTIKAKRSMVAQFVNKFRLLDDVTEYEIRRWASEKDVKGATQRSMKSFCRDFYKYLGQEVLFRSLDGSVFDGLATKPVKNKHKDVIDGRQFKPLLTNPAHTPWEDYIMLLAYTGRRSVALANLKCEDVITVNSPGTNGLRCFRIRIDKDLRPETGKPHIVPIHSRLHDLVDRLIEESKDGYLLPLKGDTIESRSDAFRAAVNKSGVTSHQFRTSVITMLHNAPEGLPEKTIYSVVGHSIGKDAHMKNYMAGLKPEALVKTVEAIDWDNWEWV